MKYKDFRAVIFRFPFRKKKVYPNNLSLFVSRLLRAGGDGK